jgi:hypothetical protein
MGLHELMAVTELAASFMLRTFCKKILHAELVKTTTWESYRTG